MRLLPIIFAGGLALGLVPGGLVSPAHAQNYPWCARYGSDAGGASNCGFVSFEQCQATLSGMGGFCDRNPQYVPGPAEPSRPPRPKRHPQS